MVKRLELASSSSLMAAITPAILKMIRLKAAEGYSIQTATIIMENGRMIRLMDMENITQ
jgi:hypothetical protein